MAWRGPKTYSLLGHHGRRLLRRPSCAVNDRLLNLIQPYCTRATLSAYPSSHIVADDIASRSFARIFEKTRTLGCHRVVASVETVRDPEHDGAFIASVARPLIILHRDFRGVANACRAVSVFGRATGIFIMLGLHAPHLLRRRSRGTADMPGMV